MAISIMSTSQMLQLPRNFFPEKKYSPRSGLQKQSYNNSGPLYFLMKMSTHTHFTATGKSYTRSIPKSQEFLPLGE